MILTVLFVLVCLVAAPLAVYRKICNTPCRGDIGNQVLVPSKVYREWLVKTGRRSAKKRDANVLYLLREYVRNGQEVPSKVKSFTPDTAIQLACPPPAETQALAEKRQDVVRSFHESVLPFFDVVDISGHVEVTSALVRQWLACTRAALYTISGAGSRSQLKPSCSLRMRVLNVSWCSLGDAGVVEVASALQDGLFPVLHTLRLDHVGMEDEGCVALCESILSRRRGVGTGNTLTLLSVQGNRFTSRALPLLLLTVSSQLHQTGESVGVAHTSSSSSRRSCRADEKIGSHVRQLYLGYNASLSSPSSSSSSGCAECGAEEAFFNFGLSLATTALMPHTKLLKLSSSASHNAGMPSQYRKDESLLLSLRGGGECTRSVSALCEGLLSVYCNRVSGLLVQLSSVTTAVQDATQARSHSQAVWPEQLGRLMCSTVEVTRIIHCYPFLTSLDLSYCALGDSGTRGLCRALLAIGRAASRLSECADLITTPADGFDGCSSSSPLMGLRRLYLRGVHCSAAVLPWLTQLLPWGCSACSPWIAETNGGAEWGTVERECAEIDTVSLAITELASIALGVPCSMEATSTICIPSEANPSVVSSTTKTASSRLPVAGFMLEVLDISENDLSGADDASAALLAGAVLSVTGRDGGRGSISLKVESCRLADRCVTATCTRILEQHQHQHGELLSLSAFPSQRERSASVVVGPSITLYLGHNCFSHSGVLLLKGVVGHAMASTLSASQCVSSQSSGGAARAEGYVEGNYILTDPPDEGNSVSTVSTGRKTEDVVARKGEEELEDMEGTPQCDGTTWATTHVSWHSLLTEAPAELTCEGDHVPPLKDLPLRCSFFSSPLTTFVGRGDSHQGFLASPLSTPRNATGANAHLPPSATDRGAVTTQKVPALPLADLHSDMGPTSLDPYRVQGSVPHAADPLQLPRDAEDAFVREIIAETEALMRERVDAVQQAGGRKPLFP